MGSTPLFVLLPQKNVDDFDELLLWECQGCLDKPTFRSSEMDLHALSQHALTGFSVDQSALFKKGQP